MFFVRSEIFFVAPWNRYLNENYDPVIVKYTLKQDSENKLLVEWLLHEKLGSYAFIVARYLEKKSRRNTMSILNTAKASMR